jgi:hypothetical protein
MTPNGKIVFKDRKTVQSMTFDLEFLVPVSPDSRLALYVDGRAVG